MTKTSRHWKRDFLLALAGVAAFNYTGDDDPPQVVVSNANPGAVEMHPQAERQIDNMATTDVGAGGSKVSHQLVRRSGFLQGVR
jgi:hypothetical protein